MMETIAPLSNLEQCLGALAVLGKADMYELAVLLQRPLTRAEQLFLQHHADIQWCKGKWVLDQPAATLVLNQLAQEASALYQTLHEQALTALATRLQDGEVKAEEQFVAIFDRLATYLVPHDPKVLDHLLAAVQAVPLTSALGQQNLRYFAGLALLKYDRHQEALASFDALLSSPTLEPRVRGRSLNSRAVCYQLLGRLEEAYTGYRASLDLWRQLADRRNEGNALLNLGILAYWFQQYPEAEENLRAAEQCFREIGSVQMLGSVHNELGLLYRDQGRWTEALHYFQTSAEQARVEGATEALAFELVNIGEVLLLQGQLAEAEHVLQEALHTMQTRAFLIDLYLALGLIRQAGGDRQGAQQAYETALEHALAIERRDNLAEVYYRLGEVLRQQGADQAALQNLIAAAEVIETAREPMRDEGLKISLIGRWQQIYETLVLHCLQLQDLAAAWQWAERARARAFAEATVVESFTDTIATLADIQGALPAGALLLNYFTLGVLDHHAPFWRALASDNPLRAQLVTPPRVVLFLVTRQRVAAQFCPVDPNAFASGSRRPEDRSRYWEPKTLTQIHKVLWPALVDWAPNRIYLVPHGPLHYVPFAALTDATGRALIGGGAPALSYAPSATILAQQWSLKPRSVDIDRNCLAVGCDQADAKFALRHSELEAQLIGELTNGVSWIGSQPKRARLAAAVRHCRWLHFACHGWFDYEKPLASYLAIAPNEHLTAEEILQTWQLDAQLVTLSACQTGVHRLLRGDEPMGLIRAFLAVGAQAVLASQWPVEDLPTFLLMHYFYRQLVDDVPIGPARALQRAQLWLKELRQAEFVQTVQTIPALLDAAVLPPDEQPFAHPRFWAGFVLFGNEGHN